MPLVFVHGVNVRQGPTYNANVNARNALFQEFLLQAVAPEARNKPRNPYWGSYAATFRWKHASLPASNVQALGAEDDTLAVLIQSTLPNQTIRSNAILLTVAHESLETAVDLLWTLAAERVRRPGDAESLAVLAVRAIDYAQHNPKPAWLSGLSDDQQFLRRFMDVLKTWQPPAGVPAQPAVPPGSAVPAIEVLGSHSAPPLFAEGLARLRSLPGQLLAQGGLALARTALNRQVSQFVGDVLVYLATRGDPQHPGQIVTEVVNDLNLAHNERSTTDPLIVVAHSMGGNIVYDILTYYTPQLASNFRIDYFVTVGSQVAVFEELKLFEGSDLPIVIDPTSDRVPNPTNVGCWLNIFDQNDVLGFATEGVFANTGDYAYATGQGLFAAHTSYFTNPSFHRRLADRIKRACP